MTKKDRKIIAEIIQATMQHSELYPDLMGAYYRQAARDIARDIAHYTLSSDQRPGFLKDCDI